MQVVIGCKMMKKLIWTIWLIVAALLEPVAMLQAQSANSPAYAASPAAQVQAASGGSVCQGVVVSRQTRNIPSEVTFQVTPAIQGVQGFRYAFGDGVMREFGSDGTQYTHTYTFPGQFLARIEVKNAQGQWVSDVNCEKSVTVSSSPVVASRTACQGIEINDTPVGFNGLTLDTNQSIKFTVIGLDTKEPLASYRLDLGDGTVMEQEDNVFTHAYMQPGRYTLRAGVKAEGDEAYTTDVNWCNREIVVGGEALVTPTVTPTAKSASLSGTLTQQPETGASTGMLLGSILMVGMGMMLMVFSLRQVRS